LIKEHTLKKKHFLSALAGFMLLTLVQNAFAGGSKEGRTSSGKSILIKHRLGGVMVPYDPQNLALLDFAALDIIDSLGMGGRVKGLAKGSTVSYLNSYTGNAALTDLGMLKEVNMEALYSLRPDVIFIGGRLSAEYDRLSQIAPVVLVAVDNSMGYMNSFKSITRDIASIFGLENKAEELLRGFDSRIEALHAAAAGKTSLAVMVTSGSINTIGNGGRCSLIFNEAGFENLAANVTSTHGDSASFELLLDKNPDYIFVIDRDSAIGTNGAKAAREIIENEVVKQTEAYKNGHIVYLTPDVWYLAEGGITATDTMLKDLELGLLGQ
jgi:iron complex transport system substrate-binding protein